MREILVYAALCPPGEEHRAAWELLALALERELGIPALPATEDDCFLVAVFCLDRAAFFGEPKAQTILKSLDKKAVTLALQDVRALNLTAPLKNLVCLTNCVLV